MTENDWRENIGKIELRGQELWECFEEIPNGLKWRNLGTLGQYANALVAAAVSECAKSLSVYFAGTTLEFYANHLRSTVTPESAAKKLERIKVDARHEGQKQEISAQMAHIKDYPNLGDCEWHCTTAEPLMALLNKIDMGRIKAEARLEEHALDCPYCRCCDGCRKLCPRRSALEAAKEK